MRLLSRVILPTPAELRASPLVDPEFLARLYHLVDGEPMPESTKHGDEIFYLYDVLKFRFADDPNVFVAQNLLWYFDDKLPLSGLAPDVFVAVGAPKGDRTSYREWREGAVRPTVVFEIVSPTDTTTDVRTKQLLYKSLGIRRALVLDGFARTVSSDDYNDDVLAESLDYSGRLIPELGIRVESAADAQLVVRGADGERFLTPTETRAQLTAAQVEAAAAHRALATAQAEAEQARAAAEAMRDRLRAAGLDPDS